MESGSQTPRSAEDHLATHERMVERAEARRIPREAAYFSLWLGVLTTVFLTIFVITFDAPHEYSPTSTMMFPLLATSLLTNGALERFGIRLKTPPAAWIGFGLGAACFVAFLALTVTDTPYPGWWRLVLPAIFVISFGAIALRTWTRSVRDHHSTWRTFPLSSGARVSTCIVASALGVLIATTATPYAPVVSSFIGMIVMLFFLVTLRTRFGLPTVGFEWGRVHWLVFSCAVSLCFGAVLLRVYAPWFTLPIAIVLGAIAAAAMAVPAFLPRGMR